MPASNDDIMKSVVTLEREFIHLQGNIEKDLKDIKETLSCHDDAIRELQDLSLMRKTEIREVVIEVVNEINKTRMAKMQAFAPYFTAIIMAGGGVAVALLNMANQTPK